MNEADTCRKYVLPKLVDSGWETEPHSFTEQRTFTEVLIAVVGSIGKVGIAPASWAGANIARAVARIVAGPNIHVDYLVSVLQSEEVQHYLLETARTLAQPTLNIGQLKEAPIPVPPLEEQRRIVTYLDGLQAKVDRLKVLQQQTAAELDALLPSILDKAFKGEL